MKNAITSKKWITLLCRKCGKTKKAPPDKSDLPGTITLRMLCPECNPGDFDEPEHLDKDGKQIPWPK